MRYSTRTRYGLRFLINLGRREAGKYAKLPEIAQEEDISVKYLEQIVRALRPSGILHTTRGVKGGYALAKTPEDISLHTIFAYLEGTTTPIPCLQECDPCPRQDRCSSRNIWESLDAHLQTFLRQVTLAQLLDCEQGDVLGL